MKPETITKILEAKKALRCLYIEVHESIADDVNKKVNNAFKALEDEIQNGKEDKGK